MKMGDEFFSPRFLIEFEFRLNGKRLFWHSSVVYFDQQTHAYACIHMVENDEKHSKIMKKYLLHHAYCCTNYFIRS